MKLNVTTEQLSKYSIFVATPMYGGSASGVFTKSTNDLATICAKHDIKLRFFYLFNESLVQRARNYCVDEFLRSDCTHLMFIDADIGFNPKDVLSLLGIQITYPDQFDILTGPYPKKSISWEKVQKAVTSKTSKTPSDLVNYTADFVFNPVQNVKSFRLDEPVEVSESGTGFMMIPRHVFEKYAEAYPELSYKPDHIRTENFDGSREITAYFDCVIDPDTKRYLSEDYFFCQKARSIGLKVHLCPWMELYHVGTYVFRGSMQHLAQLDVAPTTTHKKKPPSSKKKFRV